MNSFLIKYFLVILILNCLDAKAQEILTTSNEKIMINNFGRGILSYRYKEPTVEAIAEWKKSAIADDLIDLNLISIPDIVIDSKTNIVSYPFLDIMRWPYKEVLEAYKISRSASERQIWTYTGYKISDLSKIDDYEFKLSEPIRDFGKYERSSELSPIILPKISIKSAKKIFPEKYSNSKLLDDSEAKDFWYQVFASDISIVLAEGHKKALSLLSNGIVAISIAQDCMGLRTEYIDDNLILTIGDDLKKIFNLSPRIFYISFDHDSTPYIRDLAYSSMVFIAKQAVRYGHQSKIIALPSDSQKGVDDYIYAKGFKEFKKLYDNADSVSDFEKKYPSILDGIFEDYKAKNRTYAWCFEPCIGECVVRRLNKIKI